MIRRLPVWGDTLPNYILNLRCALIFQAVTQPEISIRKRMKKNLKKQEAKKRKIVDMRPSRQSKKHKSSTDMPGNIETF